ncbi:hypothetical protein BH09BAC3_BH09BAC3_37700 [soil metagenome]
MIRFNQQIGQRYSGKHKAHTSYHLPVTNYQFNSYHLPTTSLTVYQLPTQECNVAALISAISLHPANPIVSSKSVNKF